MLIKYNSCEEAYCQIKSGNDIVGGIKSHKGVAIPANTSPDLPTPATTTTQQNRQPQMRDLAMIGGNQCARLLPRAEVAIAEEKFHLLRLMSGFDQLPRPAGNLL